jgi:hypothetical protein
MQTFTLEVAGKLHTYRVASCIACNASNWIVAGIKDNALVMFDCLNCEDGTEDYPWN